ncbi:MAG: glycosyltransferase [Puniceicoccaceae bacterium]
MADIPKVCVITRTRNRPVLLKRAIESVLAQSMTDWQHVIVNDGGDVDELEALCRKYRKAYAGRLLILHEKHSGMQQASNAAIERTDSIYMAIHDDDDSWHPDFLKRTTAFLNRKGARSDYQGVITHTLRVLESENADGSFTESSREPYIPLNEISLIRIGFENPFPPIAFVYRRAVYIAIGTYNPRWDIAADLDFNFRFLQQFNIGVIPKRLAHYHWRKPGASTDNTNTVTTRQAKHARYLSELKNHYMRQTGSVDDLGRALSFNLSALMAETVDSQRLLREALWPIAAGTHQLQEFNRDALWPKLDGFAGAIQSLGEAFGNVSDAQASLLRDVAGLLQASDSHSASLEELQAHLEQLATFHTEALQPKLDGFAGAIQSLGEAFGNVSDSQASLLRDVAGLLQASDSHSASLEELQASMEQLATFHTDALQPKLDGIAKAIEGLAALNPNERLAALENRLEAIAVDISARTRESADRILEEQARMQEESAQLAQALLRIEAHEQHLGKFHTENLMPKVDGLAGAVKAVVENQGQQERALTGLREKQSDLRDRLDSHSGILEGIGQAQSEQTGQLSAIREEIAALREQRKRQWTFGRLRIEWLGRRDTSGSKED